MTEKLKPWPNETCGQYARRARFFHNLSQVEVAELTGIDQTNISAFENDRFNASADRIERLTSVLPAADREVMSLLAGRSTEHAVKHLLSDLSWIDPKTKWIEEPVRDLDNRVSR